MKTLILYSSHDGQTKKIADCMARQFDECEVYSILDNTFELAKFDLIIIGASIRYGHFSRSLYKMIEKNTALLNSKSSAFFGVNLTARKAGKNTPNTNVYTRKFLKRISWKPTYVAVFAGALRYPKYTWFDRVMIQFIMKITGGETDVTKEIEYTNWNEVDNFAKKLSVAHSNS